VKIPTNIFKHSLAKGEQQYGCWLGLCSPLSAELCASTGYDWMLIDGEHAPNDLQTVLSQLQAIESTPAQAVVRLPDGNPTLIKQYLDIGVQNLLIPMVENAEQARELVRAVRYPPEGIRGVGTALARAARWNLVDNYFAEINNEFCLIVQIESVQGLQNLDEILEVDGIDAIFIGPADLAASLGHLGNPAHSEVKQAVNGAFSKIKAAGKAAGSLATSQEVAKDYETNGAQFIALSVDTLLLVNAAKNCLNLFKGEIESSDKSGDGAY